MKIRIWIVLIILCSLVVTGSAVRGMQTANVLYVRPVASGTGDCYSWDNACTLQTALGKVGAGDEIWVTEGIYLPTTDVDRSATFQLVNGVALYGGFAGHETDREQRNWEEHETILSGDIGETGDDSDNSYHVVTCLDAGTILDGFTIADGNADGDKSPDDRGGGMYHEDSRPTLKNVTFNENSADNGGGMYNLRGSPTLTNVVFSHNSADSVGGGMYNEYSNLTLTEVTFSNNSAKLNSGGMYNSVSSPTLTNVTFTNNSANNDGGGMYNSVSSPMLTNVTFSNNSAEHAGGGMYNNWRSSPTLTNITFNNNSAGGGGGMYNISRSNPTLTNITFSCNSANYGGGVVNYLTSNPTLTNVTFSGNSAGFGGAMTNSERSNPTLIDVTFSNNSASFSGGGMNNISSSPTLVDITFSENFAKRGGGMNNSRGRPMLTNVVFSRNSADSMGGGMYNSVSSPTLIDVTFSGNSAGYGAGMYGDGSPMLTNVTFSDNSAEIDGGGMYNISSSPTLVDITFSENSAERGGGMYNRRGSPMLTNVTFSSNYAQRDAGGMYNDLGSDPTIANVIFSGNSADDGGGMYNNDSNPVLTNVTLSGNSASHGGGMYNYNSEPMLTSCIVWGNATSQIFDINTALTVTYSDIQGGYPGTSNINADPWFVDADGPDNIPGTPDDDLRLQALSPAIDAGDNNAVPSDITTDLGGLPRFANIPWIPDTGKGDPPLVDMGAYEYHIQELESGAAVSNSAGDTSVRLEEDLNRVDWHLVRLGQSNVAVDGFTYVNGFRFEDMNIPQGATIASAQLMLRYADWSQGLPVVLTLHAEASNDALDFSNENPLASERVLTTASTPWTIDQGPEDWFESPDLAPLVQEVVNRPGWQPGNALALLVESVAEDELRHYVDVLAYDMDPSFGARLYVSFTLPEPTPTITPTPTSTSTPTVTPSPTITPTHTPELESLYLPLMMKW